MAEVKVFYDRTGNTLVVWFGNPQDEVEAEETGDEVILMKDQQGQVIGFEKLNFLPPSDHPIRIKWLQLVHQIARWGDRFVCDSLL